MEFKTKSSFLRLNFFYRNASRAFTSEIKEENVFTFRRFSLLRRKRSLRHCKALQNLFFVDNSDCVRDLCRRAYLDLMVRFKA